MNDNIDYIKYLTLKKMNDKITKSGKNGIELENEIYKKNNIVLTEKEKIYFEFNRIYNVIEKKYNEKDLSKTDKFLYNYFYDLINNLMEIDKNNYKDCTDLKKKILNLEIYLNMKSGLYSIVPSMINEIDKEKGAI